MHRTVWAGGGSASAVPAGSAMRERALRSILLIKAVEEADVAGTLLPPADRAAASRDAAREQGEATDATALAHAGPLPRKAQRLLERRADLLHARLAARVPVVDSVLALARGPRWVGALLVVLSLAAGFSLSALDGTRRINILAFPLLGLVLWNLLVYVLVVARWMRALAAPRAQRRRRSPRLARPTRLVRRIKRLIARSAAFNTVLAEALGRFVGEWYRGRATVADRARHAAASTCAQRRSDSA